MFSFEQIKELIELVAEHGLQGLEIERSGFRVQVTGKGAGPTVPVVSSAAAEPVVVAPAALPAAPTPATMPAPEEPASAEEADGHVLESPIVGTFYAAPSPDADPFVRVGDRVTKGQILCIVEAMKLMNEIEADIDGEISKVFPSNGQPVEYGEPLFGIKP